MRVRNTVLRIEQSGVFLCGERLHAEGGAVGQFCGGNFLVFHNRYWKSDFSNSPGKGVGRAPGTMALRILSIIFVRLFLVFDKIRMAFFL